MAFHVFIERPRDASAGAAARLAAAVAERYGIPAATLTERLAAGRLRVKTGVDRDTAETFAADLETLGAVCTIVDADTGAPAVAPKPAPPPKPAATTVLPPSPRPSAPNLSAFSSALAAAKEQAPPQDLGALSSGEFALSTLDGADEPEHGHEAASFAPPDDDHAALPASIGPAIAAPTPSPSPSSSGQFAPPIDLFAPPEAQEPLALDVAPRATPRGGTTSPKRPEPEPTMAVDEPAPLPTRRRGGLFADARTRLAAGVLVAILVGFVPSMIITNVREADAFAEIDRDLDAKYKGVRDDKDWLRLDDARAKALAAKRDARQEIVIGSMLIWALLAGAIAFAWFRLIDWSRFAR